MLTSLANTRAGQSGCRAPPAPIRTPEWSSRLSGQRRILFTQPLGTTGYERRLLPPLRKLYYTLYIFPPHLSAFGHRAIFDLGGSRHGWGLFVEQTDILQGPHAQHSQTAGKLTTWATISKKILEPHSANGTVWSLVYLSTF